MFDPRALDQRPGAVPDIRAEGDSVLFCLDLPGEQARLIIRCDPDGAIYASIVSTGRT
jgi:hypothetical protein